MVSTLYRTVHTRKKPDFMVWIRFEDLFKDTHKEKAPLNKTPALTKRTNIGIRVVGASNQIFIRGS